MSKFSSTISVAVVAAVPISLRVFMRPHIEAMASRYSVALVTNAGGNALAEQMPGIRVFDVDIRREISPLADIRALFQLFLLFRREKFTAIHSLTPKAGLLAMLAGFLSRVPLRVHIFTGQVWVTRKGVGRRLLKLIDKLIAMLATHVLADSPSQRKFLVAEGVVSADSIQVLADGSICGVDVARFRPNAVVRKQVRETLQVQEDAKVVLFLGRLTRDKGILDLAKAFATLAERRPNLFLLIVGPDEEGLRARVEVLLSSCVSRVRFVGMTTVPEEYMAAADIFTLPSYREGFGSAILEAAACGVPAVASRIYGLTDAVEEGCTGLLHDAGSVDGLCFALEALIVDEPLRKQMGEAAKKRAEAKFSVQRLVAAQMTFYKTILGADSSGNATGR